VGALPPPRVGGGGWAASPGLPVRGRRRWRWPDRRPPPIRVPRRSCAPKPARPSRPRTRGAHRGRSARVRRGACRRGADALFLVDASHAPSSDGCTERCSARSARLRASSSSSGSAVAPGNRGRRDHRRL